MDPRRKVQGSHTSEVRKDPQIAAGMRKDSNIALDAGLPNTESTQPERSLSPELSHHLYIYPSKASVCHRSPVSFMVAHEPLAVVRPGYKDWSSWLSSLVGVEAVFRVSFTEK